MVGSAFREVLEAHLLPEYILRQRWFGQKTKIITGSRIIDWVELTGEDNHSVGVILLLELSYSSGGNDLYSIFAATASGEQADAIVQSAPESVMAFGRHEERNSIIYDALDSNAFTQALVRILDRNKRLPCDNGFFEGFTGPFYAHHRANEYEIKRIKSEQSNSSLLIGTQFILKLFRHLEPGVNPDFEICRHVHNIEGFTQVPAAAGMIEYRMQDPPDPYAFGFLQEFAANQGDGWTYTVEEFRRFFDRAQANYAMLEKLSTEKTTRELLDEEPPAELYELFGVYIKDANMLGRRTGELHVTLAKPTKSLGFRPEALTKDDLIDLSFSIKLDIDRGRSSCCNAA